MELSPQAVRNAQFKGARKGLDPDEVRTFLAGVADELERAQNQSTAMEARARAAVARMQEMTESAPSPATEVPAASADEAETISRTLLLAQRSADQAVADAKQEADKVLAAANLEASRTLEGSQETSARLLEEARTGAREVGKEERIALDAEVNALMARRDFLESDVEHLEQFLVAQRGRLRDAASSLVELTERVPGGLGEVRRPLLSASHDSENDPVDDHPDEDTDPYGVQAQPDDPSQPAAPLVEPPQGDDDPTVEVPDGVRADGDDDSSGTDEVTANVTTELAGLVAETDEDAPAPPTDPTPVADNDGDGFRLRFDDGD
ncbi:MAG: DivIVA domain-containing protein [Acidimicrobiia bacterium]|nr:DivIVA domain-containing protein [Acidimicrobiia bacterium]